MHASTILSPNELRVAFIATLLSFSSWAQPSRFTEEWRWAEFTTASGLPSNYVYDIVETEYGTPWVFTKSGIAWYDGYIWREVPFPMTPPLAKPQSFYADSRGRIIVVYDSTLFVGDTRGFRMLEIPDVQQAVPFLEGTLMLLRRDEVQRQRLQMWSDRGLEAVSVPPMAGTGVLLHLQRTQSGVVWLCTRECLFAWQNGRWDRRLCTGSFEFLPQHNALAENESNSGIVFAFGPSRSLELWEWKRGEEFSLNTSFAGERIVGSDIAAGGTVFLADLSGYYHVRYDDQWSTLRLPRVWARRIEMIKFRKNGDLWFCTQGGLFLCKYSSERWRFIAESPSWPNISTNEILLASDSSLWLATDGGLQVYKKNGSVTTVVRILGQNLRAVTSLLEDRDRNIWVSSGSGFTGAFRWNRSTWERIGAGTPLEKAYIHRIRMDRRGRIWLLGLPGLNPPHDQEGPGAFVYENGTITRWSLPSNRVYAFEEGPDSSLWFGTFTGLSRWKSGEWTHWTLNELFSAERVFTLAIDGEGQVWFSDSKSVVGVVSPDGNLRRITTEDGLINEQVWELKVDHKGRVWCTSPAGLAVHFNGMWTHLGEESGMRNAILWPVLPTEKEVYVGGMSGLMVLNLEGIDRPAPRLSLEHPLTSESAALLRWRASTLWASVPPEQIRTRYRVDNTTWSQWSHTHEVSIEDLSPGEHLYEVQAMPFIGGDTAFYETARSTFNISLPLTKDPRVLIPASIALLLILALLVGTMAHARRLKQEQLREELRREHEHAERLAEVDRIKSRFFANISHEFRTPLTLVLGPVDQVLSRIKDEWVHEKLVMAHRNAEKLHALINQLLDFSRIEAGTMKLAVRKGEIVAFVRRVVGSFQSWAEQKKQTLRFETTVECLEGYFDPDAVEKILNNLISNALKFTSEGGEVTVKMRLESGTHSLTNKEVIRIAVKDSGIGIAPEHLRHIFERFYRVDESHRTEGTGIGLALTKELVELHHGSISVQSTQGVGSEFTVVLPLESYAADETASTITTEHEEIPTPAIGEVPETRHEEKEPDEVHKTIVLIVEDSVDVRAYMREYLEVEYSILEADNGSEALEKARMTIPDLVVSDIMMPLMDGYELCRALKQDERTSHIPVILLTARAGMENKIEGLELGADDYLTKPFNAMELLVRIKNLIESRRRLREKFSKTVPLKPGEVAVTSLDDAFLQKAIAVVEKYMGDERFSVEQFGCEMAMSRMQLHRKLRALTNQSASEFIRYLRLQRAHELLLKKAGTVSEIAYQTGFGSLTYFTRCYHEQFGCTPSETRERGA
jgi:signal transduction histidine kinase/DNA-binding response OmpR family regulator/ligand-binding sensor domain-containing protein